MPNNTYDRYVTWAIEVPEGVAVPRLDRWTLPVYFPDPDGDFYPRDIVPMYAIRNPADATVFTEDDSAQVQVPGGYWFCFNYPNTWIPVSDDYFTGFIQDESGGTVYPDAAKRVYDGTVSTEGPVLPGVPLDTSMASGTPAMDTATGITETL